MFCCDIDVFFCPSYIDHDERHVRLLVFLTVVIVFNCMTIQIDLICKSEGEKCGVANDTYPNCGQFLFFFKDSQSAR